MFHRLFGTSLASRSFSALKPPSRPGLFSELKTFVQERPERLFNAPVTFYTSLGSTVLASSSYISFWGAEMLTASNVFAGNSIIPFIVCAWGYVSGYLAIVAGTVSLTLLPAETIYHYRLWKFPLLRLTKRTPLDK